MIKEYKAYLAYRKGRKTPVILKDTVYEDFLIHYGVKGQKWGQRQWQNTDGSYTEAGKHHYGWGYGRQSNAQNSVAGQRASRPSSTSRAYGYQRSRLRTGPQMVDKPSQQQDIEAEISARKDRAKKILGIAAGIALATVAGYGAYKGGKAIKNWSNEGKRYRHDLVRQMKYLDSKRYMAEIEKRWSYRDEKDYQKTMRSLTGTALKTYVTRKRKWTLPTYYGRTAHL